MDDRIELAARKPAEQAGRRNEIHDLALLQVAPLAGTAKGVVDGHIEAAGLVHIGDHVRPDETCSAGHQTTYRFAHHPLSRSQNPNCSEIEIAVPGAMPALVAGIPVFLRQPCIKSEMAGTSQAMTPQMLRRCRNPVDDFICTITARDIKDMVESGARRYG